MRKTTHPFESVFSSFQHSGTTEESVVGLKFGEYVALNFSLRRRWGWDQVYNTCQGIRTISQAGRTFYHFSPVNTILVHFNSVFVSPLLSFLPYPIIQSQYPIITESSDKWLGNIGTGCELCDTGQFGDRINNICAQISHDRHM